VVFESAGRLVVSFTNSLITNIDILGYLLLGAECF